jgi:large subunit ribosomal protein L10
MRVEKKYISQEYIERLNASPFFIVVDYQGLTVGQFSELRSRLAKAGGEIHVVKNSIFRIAAKESGIADLSGQLTGQLSVVTGQQEISGTAKAVKNFAAEFEKPKMLFGYLENKRLEAEELLAIADLPSLTELRASLAGVIQGPAAKLVRLLNTPARQLAQVIKAKSEKDQAA